MTPEERRMYLRRVWLLWRLARSLALFLADEYRRGTLKENLRSMREAKGLTLARDMSHAELLEEKAERYGDRPFLRFQDRVFTYREMNLNANRVANFLHSLGGGPGMGLAIVMKNSPRWLDVFFGLEKLGMYAVPVNVALRGDQLAYVLDNSDASMVVVDHDLLPYFQAVADRVEKVRKVVVNLEGAPEDFRLPEGMEDLDAAYGPGSDPSQPAVSYNPEDLCVIMYTSGTTGLPKGVVYRYNNSNVKAISVIGRLLTGRKDVAYTCYPLFHANALFLTVIPSMHCGAQVALGVRFSASRFWDEIRRHGATTFNGLGAVMPILMKQPPKPSDRDHRVRFILSAGCPADMWEDFERRFGVRIFEGYGAVDGGGVLITNFGTAPVGSMGKPLNARCRIIDDRGNDVPPGTPGELICWVGERKGSVEYYKNPEATSDKVRDGWLYTGDLVYADEKGYIYFLGRNTESMRVKGENVSAYEVEQAILKHPDVLECAVYAVPSELAEDEIMATVVPVEGKALDPSSMPAFLSDKLAKFAIPRYWRVVEELPKTETHRVIKKELERMGVTPDTYDARAGER
ncbi:AMP-binding protein [Candidatus Solincola tengchongensis]|uniref:AMP-binding protein n=1 Tax=Candidatus Solincola tengchongensis TaxID=2900693 RepID=UPI00257A7880|nr:AMP-binding protein [Candidatus Solincola tengchongensis]